MQLVGKGLSVLFGMVSEEKVKIVRKRLKTVKKILAQAAKKSMSILNGMRVELAKNRGSINKLISEMRLLSRELANILEVLEKGISRIE